MALARSVSDGRQAVRVMFVHVSKNWQGRVYPEYPLGVGLIATLTQSAGHTVDFLDMAVDHSAPSLRRDQFNPDVIALSFLSTAASTAREVIRELKEDFGGFIVAGGIHTSVFPEDTLSMGADVAVIGEGEPVVERLLEVLSALHCTGRIPRGALAGVPGVAYRNERGFVERSGPPGADVDVDLLPPVDRDIFDLSRYPHHSIITSRGCPYRCKFCCAWGPGGKKGRMASPERILGELESLVERFGPMTMYWADDMFFFSQKKRLEFCGLMKARGLPIEWIAQLRADNLNPELVAALRGAGCVKVCLGAEAGSDTILRAIDKGLTRKAIKAGIQCAVHGGLRVKTWWIVGLPGGTYAEQLESLGLIAEARPHEVAVHTFVPLPGTAYWDRASEYGITLPSLDGLEALYYYGDSDAIGLSYLSSTELRSLFRTFDAELESLGYVPTDRATEATKYVYTSPTWQRTFQV